MRRVSFAIGPPRFQGDTFTARQVAVEMLISNAYGLASKDAVDGPGWIYFATGERVERPTPD